MLVINKIDFFAFNRKQKFISLFFNGCKGKKQRCEERKKLFISLLEKTKKKKYTKKKNQKW